MTWNEFKNFVDKELEENEISQDTEIWYIDISFPPKDNEGFDTIIISIDEKLGISIG